MNAPPRRWFLRDLPFPEMKHRLMRFINRIRAPAYSQPIRTALPYTLLSVKRLRTLHTLARQAISDRVPGDFVECGVAAGGSGALLALVAVSDHDRHVWLLDSFQGLPAPGERDGQAAARFTGTCYAPTTSVVSVLNKLGVPERTFTLVPGWFDETLPKLPTQQIALLHLDGDWYDSITVCLRHLYDRVTPGGFIVLDDYGYWEGCRRAWHDFVESRSLSIDLHWTDAVGVYARKP